MNDPTPLDPDSPRGKQLRAELSKVLAQVQLNILARRAAAELTAEATQLPTTPPSREP